MNPIQAVSAPPEYTRELVGFLHSLRAPDLPAEVLDRGRYFLLDYLAVAVRGSREKSARCPLSEGRSGKPLSWEEMAGKFRALAGPVPSAERRQTVIEHVGGSNPGGLAALCAC